MIKIRYKFCKKNHKFLFGYIYESGADENISAPDSNKFKPCN